MTSFTPLSGLLGGVLIGLSASLLMSFNGRIAGISGILGELLAFRRGAIGWRLAFIAGLVTAPLLYRSFSGALPFTITPSVPVLIVGGLLVGIGTRMGSGCTSGHGVCGLARFSKRSLAATLIFMAAGIATVFVARHLIGG
ncbi:MAG TPA: YeeE/YedE family protein [Methylovirgula sp.]